MTAAAALKITESDLRSVEREIAELARWERLNGTAHNPLRADESHALAARYLVLVAEREENVADVERTAMQRGSMMMHGYGYGVERLAREQRAVRLVV